LRRSASGAAVTEFALAAPLVMTAGLWGVESAHRAVVQMRINQVAVLVAEGIYLTFVKWLGLLLPASAWF